MITNMQALKFALQSVGKEPTDEAAMELVAQMGDKGSMQFMEFVRLIAKTAYDEGADAMERALIDGCSGLGRFVLLPVEMTEEMKTMFNAYAGCIGEMELGWAAMIKPFLDPKK